MARIQKILVPVDGSEPSLAALNHALALANDLGASVDVLRVVTGRTEVEIAEAERERERAIEEAETKLAGRLHRRSEVGDPERKILEIAGTEGFDLIVMGTHGRVGRLHSLVGSVAEAIVRNAPCPVLTVREPSGVESFSEHVHHRPTITEQTRSR